MNGNRPEKMVNYCYEPSVERRDDRSKIYILKSSGDMGWTCSLPLSILPLSILNSGDKKLFILILAVELSYMLWRTLKKLPLIFNLVILSSRYSRESVSKALRRSTKQA